jgi:UDP-N-acetylmuramoyl-tripeptide--D-alanyl-D-alanine ligase
MMPLDLAEVCRVTGGTPAGPADPDAIVTGPVVIDSRLVVPGALFVAVRGERADGHDFAAAAVAAGAVAVLAERDVGVPAVLVGDTQAALGRLAHAVLDRVPGCTVVGVTGSSGKTSTKDLLAQVLEAVGPTVAPSESFNNELGLPLTVLRIDADTRVLVCEYGARGRGHIRALCEIARPDIAVVLNVGSAHLGEFGTRDDIAVAKGELVEALPSSGVAVLNADDARVAAMAARTEARTMTFGAASTADVRVVGLTVDDLARPRFTIETAQGAAPVTLQVHGRHHAFNAAAAAAAGLAAGLDLATVVAGLERASARSAHRMALVERSDGLLVIDDAYNANPESVRAAIDAMVVLAGGRRTWAVLGEMRELGPDAEQMHVEVGRYAAEAGVDEVLAVGRAARVVDGAASVAGWPGRARGVAAVEAAGELLLQEISGSDVVLLKASNTIQLWTLVPALSAGVAAAARGGRP